MPASTTTEYGFGRYTFRHRRTGKTVVMMAGSMERARAGLMYEHVYDFVGWAVA